MIASVYTDSTERRALDALIALGARVKVSYEIARTRLHAKAWLFHRDSGLHTAYIGSSNLTHAAQVDGLEWNVRVSAAENPEVIERFEATFEQYWQEPEFEDYEPGRDAERLDRALSRQSHEGSKGDGLDISLLIDVAPKPHQAVALDALESERQSGHRRNLVVAATGTGKTWVAAFDFKRLRSEGKGDSLLFVAHRDEILRQSQQVFQLVLREPGFGERLIGGERPRSGRHVFASVQSLANRVDDIEPDGFDVVIVDEFHHAAPNDFRVGQQFTGEDAANMIRALRDAAHCIRWMPATFTTYPGSADPVFPCKPGKPVRTGQAARLDDAFLWSFGTFSVPTHLWQAMSRYAPWIEPAILNEWIEIMRGYSANPVSWDDHLTALRWLEPEHDTGIVRALGRKLRQSGSALFCVWTGRRLRDEFDVDHCFPFAAWPCNDLWNLLPSSATVNRSKGDRLPAPEALEQARPRMLEWWDRAYLRDTSLAARFEDEVRSALPAAAADTDKLTPESLFEGIMIQQIVLKRDQQLAEWVPGM